MKIKNDLISGEVAEWKKAHAWKACKVILSWVRIPFSPPKITTNVNVVILLFVIKFVFDYIKIIMNICIFYTSPKLGDLILQLPFLKLSLINIIQKWHFALIVIRY